MLWSMASKAAERSRMQKRHRKWSDSIGDEV